MIYDCFMFYNELELLEIRLNILNDHVDRFVLVEQTVTHAGNPKPLHYAENKDRFEPFNDKIIYVRMEDDPSLKDSWARENRHRNGIMRGLADCQPSDRILISDLDEIPSPEALKTAPPSGGPIAFRQLMLYYWLNNLNRTLVWWSGSCLIEFGSLQRTTPQAARMLAIGNRRAVVKNGGWHFSYLGDPAHISNKIKNFAHQEYNSRTFTDERIIQEAMDSGQDLFGRPYRYVPVELDDSFPSFLVERQDQYAHLIRRSTDGGPRVSTVAAERRKRWLLGLPKQGFGLVKHLVAVAWDILNRRPRRKRSRRT